MSSEFFDIKHTRCCGMIQRDKNLVPVLPLKPMTFLVMRHPAVFQERPDVFIKSVRSDRSEYQIVKSQDAMFFLGCKIYV